MWFLVLFIPLIFGGVVLSGDGGEAFAQEKAQELCSEGAVYVCNGNVVRLVVNESYYVFYSPDGRIDVCDLTLTPSEMGARCALQLLHPNFCPQQPVCTPDNAVSPPSSATENMGLPVKAEEKEKKEEPTLKSSSPPSDEKPSEFSILPPRSNFDAALKQALLVVLGIGVFALAVLFLLFKKSSEDVD